MTIDSDTGIISWQPVAGQEGLQDIIVRASNRVGDTDQTFTISVLIDTFPPTIPTNLQVVDVGTTTIDLSWTASSDAVGVDHYNLYTTRTCGTRFSRHTCYDLVLGNIVGPSARVTGLTPLSSANYVVRAFDAAGNQSPGYSNGASATTLSAPIGFSYIYGSVGANPIEIPAKSLLQFQLVSNANPSAITYSLVSGPVGMTVTSAGQVDWTPMVADVGVNEAIFQATNSVGSNQLTISITVTPDAPRLSYQFTQPTSSAIAGVPYSLQINDASNTPPTFQLVAAPPGMTIDAVTGLISWLPTGTDGGPTTVTVRAANSAGTNEISINFFTHFTNSVTGILVTDLTALHPLASWTGADWRRSKSHPGLHSYCN